MPTGFQKFANKALQEGPISINGQQQGETPESREVKKFETVSRTGMESRGGARARRIDEETTTQKEETQPVEKAAEAAEVQKPVEKLFQATICFSIDNHHRSQTATSETPHNLNIEQTIRCCNTGFDA